MPRDQVLEDLCMAFIEALKAINITDELPPYLSTKAREANALSALEALKKSLPEDGFKRLYEARDKARVSIDLDIAKKEDLINEMIRLKPAIDRIKSSGFKLMLERFEAAHDLANYLSAFIDEIVETERPGALKAAQNN